jgi:hypothetical protein
MDDLARDFAQETVATQPDFHRIERITQKNEAILPEQ